MKREKRVRDENYRQFYRVRYSLMVRAIVFILMLCSVTICATAGVLMVYMDSQGYNTKRESYLLEDALYDECIEIMDKYKKYIASGDFLAVAYDCAEKNIVFELYIYGKAGEYNGVIWSSGEPLATDIVIDRQVVFAEKDITPESLENEVHVVPRQWYLMRIYVDPVFSKTDSLWAIAMPIKLIYQYQNEVPIVSWGSAGVGLLCLIYFLCAAGHKNGRKGISPSIIGKFYMEIVTAGLVAGIVAVYCAVDKARDFIIDNVLTYQTVYMVIGILCIYVLVFMYLMEVTVRIKLDTLWESTILSKVVRVLNLLFGKLSLVAWTSTCVGILIVLEAIGVFCFKVPSILGTIYWIVMKILWLAAAVYVAVSCKEILIADRALVEGRENYRIDTSKMYGQIKEHGENLNNISVGITKAVEARMKSERLKTELITNVSHDLKTPLTSIINYADLICEEKSENPKIAEYSEVLLRQSRRMKKLLEDLMEASKATTGNLEVNLVPCEVGVLLTQAVGEYEQKLAERDLELIVHQPEEEIKIMADSRHLWRVFDNLFNNVFKYAHEQSRVYLSLETALDDGEEFVRITLKNMSKYALDISAEELEERFVRGDKSRHIEGNGLGLSIAKSLMALQNGKMQIVTDGDLFKVILEFRALKEKENSDSATG